MPVELPIDHLPELWLTNFAARASVRWFIGFGFLEALNTHHKSWSGTVRFVSPGRIFWTSTRISRPDAGQHGGMEELRASAFAHPGLQSLRRPSRTYAEMLEGLDVIGRSQDVGSRYYTFVWTLYLSMRASRDAACSRCVGSAKTRSMA